MENAEEKAERKRAGDDGGSRNQGDGSWGSWGPGSGCGEGAESGLGDLPGERAGVHTCSVNQPEIPFKELSLSRE